MNPTRELYIRDQGTDEIIHRVDVSGRTDREVEKIERGILRNMDDDRYVLCDSRDDEDLAPTTPTPHP